MRERDRASAAFLRRAAPARARSIALLVVARHASGSSLTEDVGRRGRASSWALDTVATIGSHPGARRPSAGQIVKVLLIVLGVGTLFYGLVTVTEFFVAGHLADLLAERRDPKA